MRIRDVSYAVVEANFDWTLVAITDHDGRTGIGECFFAPGLPGILDELAPLLVGQDPRQIGPLVNRLYLASSGAGSTAGLMLNAISGLDAALWDLAARSLEVPLWQMLGGRMHDRVRVYADCHSSSALTSLGPLLQVRRPRWADRTDDASVLSEPVTLFEPGAETGMLDLDQVREQAATAVKRGFDALKFDVDVPGFIPANLGSGRLSTSVQPELRAYVAAIVEGAGPGVDVALDCHWRYDLATARMIGKVAAEFDLLWLEDPLPPENRDGLVDLSRSLSVPLATGENLGRWAGFAGLIDQRAVAVVTPDLGKVGGLADARLIAQAAHANGLSIAPHNIAGPVGTAFAAQVSATFPNLIALEFHALSVPFFDELINEGPLIENGHIAITDRPGIGVTLNHDAVAARAKPGVPVFGDPA